MTDAPAAPNWALIEVDPPEGPTWRCYVNISPGQAGIAQAHADAGTAYRKAHFGLANQHADGALRFRMIRAGQPPAPADNPNQEGPPS